MKRLIFTLFIVAVCVSSASAVTYQVGPSRTYHTLQNVAGLLNPGDLVEVDGNATYPGDIILTRPGTVVNKITIRGIRVNGLRPVLSGGTNTIEFRHFVVRQLISLHFQPPARMSEAGNGPLLPSPLKHWQVPGGPVFDNLGARVILLFEA